MNLASEFQGPVPAACDDARWAAVVRRDPAADDAFVYGVSTTGVFCRPSCPARTARRRNVTFYPSPAAAEQAGLRPCRRCDPKGPSLAEKRGAAVSAAVAMIESAEEIPSLDALARAAGMSRYHFVRVFKAVTGTTPVAYARAVRDNRARRAIAGGERITRAIMDAGYNTNSRFYEKVSEKLGMRPSQLRQGGAGTRVWFAVGTCTLGAVLVAATANGVCAILVGDGPDELLRDLRATFPRAGLVSAEPSFESVVAQVIALVDNPTQKLDLPLDIMGTAFQVRVWQALRGIPPGTTASYAEIARRVGQPRAVRAVAQACASNRLAVAIPCHRVVRADGALSGYRWGIERKRRLLEREASAT